MDRRTDESGLIRRCPTNVERPRTICFGLPTDVDNNLKY